MQPPGAIIFDFDGVLLESELEGNSRIAEVLTELGHETSLEEALDHFVGLSGQDFVEAVEARIDAELPMQFHVRMKELSVRALRDGIAEVAGAVDFVRSLPPELPIAVASSSSTKWLRGHLRHLGLEEAFGDHVYSGREHVERSKPAPDVYLHAAQRLRVPIAKCVIVEDSRVGAAGALASGARVVGFAGASHCRDGHADMLRGLGVRDIAHSFDELRRLLAI
jgi:HAD superfamily hydrolase (TIGR01509 family)